jgi:hypothetical protein
MWQRLTSGQRRMTGHPRLYLIVAGVVAVTTLAVAGPAFAADLVDVYDHASGTSRPTYDHSSEQRPTYDAQQATWDSLNQTSDDLAQDATADEEHVGATRNEDDVNDCFKAALWEWCSTRVGMRPMATRSISGTS